MFIRSNVWEEEVQAVNMEYLFILQVISNSSNNHKLAQNYILHKWSQPESTEWTLYKHSIPFLMSPVIRDEREREEVSSSHLLLHSKWSDIEIAKNIRLK